MDTSTSKKVRQFDGYIHFEEGQTILWPKKKGQRTNNDLQIKNTTQKTKDRATRTSQKNQKKNKTGMSSGAPEG